MRIRPTSLLVLSLAFLSASCGDSQSPTSPGGGSGPSFSYTLNVTAGSGQTIRVGTEAGPVSLQLLRSDGMAVSGASLQVSVTAGGGSVNSASLTTDAQGRATISGWVVGSTPGANRLTVSSSEHSASTDILATARYPLWTVMVYMAADNSLAVPGLLDLEEMESVAADPEVQVVVQAEFSPKEFSFYGCDASCLNRPNWNTVRYRVQGGTGQLGFDGPVEDIGAVDMTDPAELVEFIQWSQANYPGERYLLVPWNHGGGHTGLIEDVTHGGAGEVMTLTQFRAALQQVPTIDIIDFDMCSMAAYETLTALHGEAEFSVFSEELVPGDGLPYERVIPAIQQAATAPTETVVRSLVDVYHDAYVGSRSSTTKSAYRVAGTTALDDALGDLAAVMIPRLPTLQTDLQSVLRSTQKFAIPAQTDIADFAQRMNGATNDSELSAALDVLLSVVTDPSFRVNNRVRNGNPTAPDVSGGTGLHFVFPSGVGADRFASTGPRSLSAYESEYPNSQWADLLAAWNQTLTSASVTDLGPVNRLELYILWQSAAQEAGADVDMLLVEPSGNIYLPWIGVITPNGHLTADSYEIDSNYEGFISNRHVENGTYRWYAWLWTDPTNHQTLSDVAYRFNANQEWTWLYEGNEPLLSTQVRFEDDPTPTFAEADRGDYTNLKWVAEWGPGQAAPTLVAPTDAPAAAAPSEITDAQRETLLQLLRDRPERPQRSGLERRVWEWPGEK